MKILVTGANGYLGQGIVKKLLDDGVDVVATDFSCENIDDRAHVVCCNMFEVNNPFEYFGEPDVLLHMAWRDGFIHNSENHIKDLPQHTQFITDMVKGGVKRIAVMGSMHEIGFFEGCIDDNTVCRPKSMYGIAKDALRNLVILLAEQNSISYQWLRGYYIVGNCEHGSSIFSKIVMAEKENKPEFPFTLGQNQYDFIDYEDFCIQVAATVEQEEVNGIINICSGRPEKLADRVERFISENQYKIKLKYGAFPDRPYDSKAIWGNNKKIMQILEKNRM